MEWFGIPFVTLELQGPVIQAGSEKMTNERYRDNGQEGPTGATSRGSTQNCAASLHLGLCREPTEWDGAPGPLSPNSSVHHRADPSPRWLHLSEDKTLGSLACREDPQVLASVPEQRGCVTLSRPRALPGPQRLPLKQDNIAYTSMNTED